MECNVEIWALGGENISKAKNNMGSRQTAKKKALHLTFCYV